MGKKFKKAKRTAENTLLSTPVKCSDEFEGLVSFEEISSCTFMKLSKSGKVKRELWENGKITKLKYKKEKLKNDVNKNKVNKKEKLKKDVNKNKVNQKKSTISRNTTNKTVSVEKPAEEADVKEELQPAQSSELPKKKKKKRKKKPVDGAPAKKARYDNATFHGAKDRPKDEVDVSSWKSVFVPPEVLQAICELGFTSPTEIQKLVLPAAIKGRMDIIGAAETGSGKTLAFGIPIIHGILLDLKNEAKHKDDSDKSNEEPFENGDEVDAANGEEESASEDNVEEVDASGGEENIPDEVTSEDDASNGEENIPDEDIGEVVDALGIPNEDIGEEVDASGGEEDGTEEEFVEMGKMEDEDSEDEQDDGEDFPDAEEIGCPFLDVDNDSDGDSGEFDDNGEAYNGQEFGCVKVIDNVDFDFLEKDQKKTTSKTSTHSNQPLRALIVTPTRELAVQVKSHLASVLVHTNIKVAVVIGGVASEKQKRILNRRPEIVVGTPGRLWELVEQGNEHLSQIGNVKYLAIDETDRMVEQGHFEELQKLLEIINSNEAAQARRQNFVFSATLTLVHNAPKRLKMQRKTTMTSEIKVKHLAKMIGLKAKPKVVDVTRKFGTAQSLTESRINCNKVEKDYYLYYILKQYPGRTLVFCNSIDCVRRLQNLFTFLECQPMSLHASMHQKQRLKSLEKFSNSSQALLLATDVAARGLDIPNIQHVIHYQTPRTAETYVHRSGRTARAEQEGLSVLFIDSTEMKKYRQMCFTLNRANDLPPFPVNVAVLEQVIQRVKFARDIESKDHINRKEKAHENWFKKAAREAELHIDSDEEDEEDDGLNKQMKEARERRRAKVMKAKLRKMLSKPLVGSTFSGKYPTQTGTLVFPVNQGEKEGGNKKGGSDALSLVKKEAVEFDKLAKKVKPRPPKKRVNKKKNKGFEKRREKLMKEREKIEKEDRERQAEEG